MYNCERMSWFVIFEDTPFIGRPVDGWNVAARPFISPPPLHLLPISMKCEKFPTEGGLVIQVLEKLAVYFLIEHPDIVLHYC
jgi:hypothetical protein